MILDNILNYYEKLVFDEILRYQEREGVSHEEHVLEDVACVALNDLPARYVRHSVDIMFYLTGTERETMAEMVTQAVKEAFVLVTSNPHSD